MKERSLRAKPSKWITVGFLLAVTVVAHGCGDDSSDADADGPADAAEEEFEEADEDDDSFGEDDRFSPGGDAIDVGDVDQVCDFVPESDFCQRYFEGLEQPGQTILCLDPEEPLCAIEELIEQRVGVASGSFLGCDQNPDSTVRISCDALNDRTPGASRLASAIEADNDESGYDVLVHQGLRFPNGGTTVDPGTVVAECEDLLAEIEYSTAQVDLDVGSIDGGVYCFRTDADEARLLRLTGFAPASEDKIPGASTRTHETPVDEFGLCVDLSLAAILGADQETIFQRGGCDGRIDGLGLARSLDTNLLRVQSSGEGLTFTSCEQPANLDSGPLLIEARPAGVPNEARAVWCFAFASDWAGHLALDYEVSEIGGGQDAYIATLWVLLQEIEIPGSGGTHLEPTPSLSYELERVVLP